MINLILPEVHEELQKNALSRRILSSSPSNSIEEQLNGNSKSKFKAQSVDSEDEKALIQINNILDNGDTNNAPFTIPSEWNGHLPSFPLLKKQKTKLTNAQPTDENILPSSSFMNPFASAPSNYINSKNDPVKEIEDALYEMDDDNSGKLDFTEFGEAIQVIDDTIIHGEIEAMYDTLNNLRHKHQLLHQNSFAGWNQTELSDLEKQMKNAKKKLSNGELYENNIGSNESLSVSRSTSNGQSDIGEIDIPQIVRYLKAAYAKHSNNGTIIDSKKLLRIAFPCIFDKNSNENISNSFGVTTTKLWGIQKTSSSHKLKEILLDESADENTLDFIEFQTTLQNLGIAQFKPDDLELLFSNFISLQSASITTKHLHKRKEINIDFFTKFIQQQISNHDTMQPKEILITVFDKLLTEGIRSSKGSHKNILNVDDGNHLNVLGDDDVLPEDSPNPYFDDNLMENVSKEFAPDQNKKFEKNHMIDPRLHAGLKENGKSERKRRKSKLVRMESSAKWKKEDMDDLESQLKAQLSLMQNDQRNKQLEPTMVNDLTNSMTTQKIGALNEDTAVE